MLTDREIIRHQAVLDQRVAYVEEHVDLIIDDAPERLDVLLEAANAAPGLVSREAAGMDAVHGACSGIEE